MAPTKRAREEEGGSSAAPLPKHSRLATRVLNQVPNEHLTLEQYWNREAKEWFLKARNENNFWMDVRSFRAALEITENDFRAKIREEGALEELFSFLRDQLQKGDMGGKKYHNNSALLDLKEEIVAAELKRRNARG